MRDELQNLNKIFTDKIFRIPDYQRGYAWSSRQLKDFWNDLMQLDINGNHYLGVLTLEDVGKSSFSGWADDLWIIESKSYSPFFVVDGQQRLTTAIILIQAILEYNKDDQKISYFTNNEIRKRFIFDSRDEGISRSYIFGYEKDNPSYEFLKTKIFLERTENCTSIEETAYTHNLERAKGFFAEKLTGLSFNEVQVVFKKITQHFLFNVYSISSDIDVCVAFETMNNRGKPLSILELLKNRLIFLSTRIDSDSHERTRLRHAINESWKTVYHYLGRNKEKPLNDDVFLMNHFFCYFGRSLFKEKDEQSRYIHFIRREYHFKYKDYLLENIFTLKNAMDGKIIIRNDQEISFNIGYIYLCRKSQVFCGNMV